MAGNARFHDKLHRKNHHSIPTIGFPDSATDPIASREEPFQGDFVVNGVLSASSGIELLSAKIQDGFEVGGNAKVVGEMTVEDILYITQLSGTSTETILSDSVVLGNGNNTLTISYANGVFLNTPQTKISDALNVTGILTVSNYISSNNYINISNNNSSISPTLSVKQNSSTNNIIAKFSSNLKDDCLEINKTNIKFGLDLSASENFILSKNLSVSGITTVDDLVVQGSIVSPILNNLQSISGNWNQSYTTLTSNSAKWDQTYTVLTANSSNWSQSYTILTNTSANWNQSYAVLIATSSNWNQSYTALTTTSGNWNQSYTALTNTSGNWNQSYTALTTTSGNWNQSYTALTTTSGNWNQSYTSLTATSSNWNQSYTALTNTSGNWNQSYTSLTANSSQWQRPKSTYVNLTAVYYNINTTLSLNVDSPKFWAVSADNCIVNLNLPLINSNNIGLIYEVSYRLPGGGHVVQVNDYYGVLLQNVTNYSKFVYDGSSWIVINVA